VPSRLGHKLQTADHCLTDEAHFKAHFHEPSPTCSTSGPGSLQVQAPPSPHRLLTPRPHSRRRACRSANQLSQLHPLRRPHGSTQIQVSLVRNRIPLPSPADALIAAILAPLDATAYVQTGREIGSLID
jgi:hypothetical protein